MTAKDTGYAPTKWAFDDEVTRVFEDMLWRSIPGYAIMRSLCRSIAARHARGGGVVDLGCSRGGAIADLLPFDFDCFTGAEISKPMVDACRARFADEPRVDVHQCDLRHSFPMSVDGSADVVLAVLTLQFVPMEYRARLVQRSATALRAGGVMLVVEKTLGETAWGDELLVADYYDFKRSNGYTDEEIDRKRLALEGVLVPLTESANVEMLRRNGFRDVQTFWRYLNFCGWVATK